MTFDVSLPFVDRVYELVGQGELDECARWLTELIRSLPATQLHCIVNLCFDEFLPAYSDWLLTACNGHPRLDASVAVCASMGEFEINYQDWAAEVAAYDNYREIDEPFEWLCESARSSLGDWFHFTGLDELQAAFAHASDYDDLAADPQPPYPSDVYTAACYLFFVRFLQLNRQTHQLANATGHALSRAHLFCYYGDCLYHSGPIE
jgi:hypothetical protein